MEKILCAFFVALFLLTTAAAAAEDEAQAVLMAIGNDEEAVATGAICPTDLLGQDSVAFEDFYEYCDVNRLACFEKCKSGSANHCYGLAYLLEGENPEPFQIDLLFAMACKRGYVSGCTNVAGRMMLKQPSKNACYAATFKMTCESGDSWGCAMYGNVLHRGDGVEKDLKKALEMSDRACAKDVNSRACLSANKRKAKIVEEIKQSQRRPD